MEFGIVSPLGRISELPPRESLDAASSSVSFSDKTKARWRSEQRPKNKSTQPPMTKWLRALFFERARNYFFSSLASCAAALCATEVTACSKGLAISGEGTFPVRIDLNATSLP